MKKILFLAFLILSISFLFVGHRIARNVVDFDTRVERQTIKRRQSALKKSWKQNEKKVFHQNSNELIKPVSEKKVNEWITYFEELDNKCKALNKEYFANKDYVDAESDLYDDQKDILEKYSKTFKNIFNREGSKKFFTLFESKITQCDSKSLEMIKDIFSNTEVCREFEAFYFVESVFEASIAKNYSKSTINELRVVTLNNSLSLLDDQKTMENSLFVLSILKKMPSTWFVNSDDYLIKEIDAYYEEVLERWKNFGSDMVDLREKSSCNYFQDYFYEVEEINNRIKDFIEDLRHL